jgi:hypothetical protein
MFTEDQVFGTFVCLTDTNTVSSNSMLIDRKEVIRMAEDKGKKSSGNDPKGQTTQAQPPPKCEIEVPGFKWVTKGEKGSGVEPGVQINDKTE